MTKKIRFIILFVCALLFLIITPYILLYSLGYRVDFAKMKILPTGGIYVRVLPPGADVAIDSATGSTAGFFTNSVFVQNLLPKEHTIIIKKDGYNTYQKNLLVQENQVTKLEHVVLIKKNITFNMIDNSIDYVSSSPNGTMVLAEKITDTGTDIEVINLQNQQKKIIPLPTTAGTISDVTWSNDSSNIVMNISGNYFLLNAALPQIKITPLPLLQGAGQINFNLQNPNEIFFMRNNAIYSTVLALPIIKNALAYHVFSQSITWLSADGFLYNSNLLGSVSNKLTLLPFNVKETSNYEIFALSGTTFLKEDDTLYWLDLNSQSFEHFYDPIQQVISSPNGQKILYYNDHEILYSDGTTAVPNTIFLNRFSDTISNCSWLNDDYVIFQTGNAMTISEIDVRGNINMVNLPQEIPLPTGGNITVNQEKIFFNQQDKKLYILTGNTLLSSERLIP
jgi:hypothetical protein